jgi:hypothetical protein
MGTQLFENAWGLEIYTTHVVNFARKGTENLQKIKAALWTPV